MTDLARRQTFGALGAVLATAAFTAAPAIRSARAATAADLDRDVQQSLQQLYRLNPTAERLSRTARGILVFPNIVKAGLIFGGAYGEGSLLVGGRTENYYNSVSASWGLQAGAQAYSYAVFLMSEKAIKYLRDTSGLEIGVGPTVVVADQGAGKNLSSSTLQDDAYAFIFGQEGLMASLSIEGTKITKIRR